jgi:hypothetical protein
MSTSLLPTLDQLLLPFAEKEYIDLGRAAHILGTTKWTVMLLFQRKLIEMIDYAPGKRKRVHYRSIADFCDELRRRHAIEDRRPKLDHPIFRHADADLLPFPLEDTISIEHAAEILGYSSVWPVRLMIEEGRFEAYQLFRGSPWRVSKLSLAAYLQRVHQQNSRNHRAE